MSAIGLNVKALFKSGLTRTRSVGVGNSAGYTSYAGDGDIGPSLDDADDTVYRNRSICSIEAKTLYGKLLATNRVSRVGTHACDHRVGLYGPALVSCKIAVSESWEVLGVTIS